MQCDICKVSIQFGSVEHKLGECDVCKTVFCRCCRHKELSINRSKPIKEWRCRKCPK